jgi:hypothetical protein
VPTVAANRELFERWVDAVQSRDFAALDELAHPDFEDFFPQSGEVTRGIDNFKAILTNYPGGVEALGRDRIVGGEERWIRTPMFTVLRVEGSEDVFTGVARARYPDGSVWFIVGIGEMRDGRVYRSQTFFAPTFEPPEWRAQWVTRRARPGE